MTNKQMDTLAEMLNGVLPEGWTAERYDYWAGTHPNKIEIVAPGNNGAGFVMATIRLDGTVRVRDEEDVRGPYIGPGWMDRLVEHAAAFARSCVFVSP